MSKLKAHMCAIALVDCDLALVLQFSLSNAEIKFHSLSRLQDFEEVITVYMKDFVWYTFVKKQSPLFTYLVNEDTSSLRGAPAPIDSAAPQPHGCIFLLISRCVEHNFSQNASCHREPTNNTLHS